MSTMKALTAIGLLTAMVITVPATSGVAQESAATTIQQAVATALEQNPQVKVAANAVRSAEARLTAARAALSPTVSASVGASTSGSGTGTSIARAAAAERAAAAAREAFRAAEGRYTAGVGTVVEVETARTELVTAEVSLRPAQSDQWTTLVTLRRALGLPVIP